MNMSKKPFKLVEIPVNNFKEVAIPHHLKLLAEHKETVQKEHDDNNKMRSETASIKRIIAQLKGLLYELDTLRAQVEDEDLDKFDIKTVSLRKNILQIISEYSELLKQTIVVSTPSPKKQSEYGDNAELSPNEPKQLQITADLNELKLQESEARLQNVEKLQTDIEDLHSAYGTLHQLVVEQKDSVTAIEENVETADHNVSRGAEHILTAARLKASVYPVTGAIVGTCVGGPLGLIAGIKVGGLAALGCGVLGYVGGKFIKKRKLSISAPEEPVTTEKETDDNSRTKKDE